MLTLARQIRWLLALIALLFAAATIPAVPAAWTTYRHPTAVSNKVQALSGWVQVSRCVRDQLPHDYKCTGDFIYANPLSAPTSAVTYNVVLANDPGSHHFGTSVSAALTPGSHTAYRWGSGFYLEMVYGLILGYICCLIVLILTPVASRLKAGGWVVGLFLALGTWALLPTLSSVWTF